MIELIEGLPDGVVGIEAVGNVTHEDYDDVVAPALERAFASHQKIRLLHVLGDRLTGHSASALLEDAKLGLSNVRSIERIAVVTDIAHFRTLVKGARWTLPGDLKLFPIAERAEAEAWVSEGLRPRTRRSI
jgi:SpoIIAA-like